MGSPAALMALLTSLRPFPDIIPTTVASLGIRPSWQAFLIPAAPVTPAGSPKSPHVRPSILMAPKISSSVTFTAIPFDSLTALRALSAFLGTPTAMESAIVFSSMGCQGLPV